MNYPGDSSLSQDIRSRILATFDQTLSLAEQGSRQEALLGCDFVLRMDPHFTPARRLQERLDAGNGGIRVDDLRAAMDAPADNLFDLSALSDELPDLPHEAGTAIYAEAEGLFTGRRFEELLALVDREPEAVAADTRLAGLAEAARERLEAGPYVAKFLAKARQLREAGDAAEAAKLIEKARALDPSHPGLGAAANLDGTGAPAAPPIPTAAPAPPPLTTTAELPAALRPSSMLAGDDLFGGTGDSESDRRIAQLLAEGQTALDAGDPQGAIDSWSRIFLIDIDHQEAARRIDLARKVKAESERQVEEVFHDGVARLESGDMAGARQAFERVLEMQPSYLAAREYLDQIEAGTVSPSKARPVVAGPAMSSGVAGAAGAAASMPAVDLPDLGGEELGDLKEEILVPPEPGEAARGERKPVLAAVRAGRFDRKFLYVGGAVLALLLAAAGYFALNWDSLFPNSHPTDELAAPSPPDPLENARKLHQQGKTAVALAQLRRVLPSDPNYDRAQALMAELQGPPGGSEPPPLPTLSPEVEARRQALLASARQEFAGADYLRAVSHFQQAGSIAKLEGPDSDQLATAQRKIEPLEQQIHAFKDHEWEYVIPALWRLHETSPGDRTVDRLLVDSYYNLGVRDLQHFDPQSAAKNFEQVLELDPDDATAKRQLLFAQTYMERPQDLLFRIYVKYLPYR